MIKIKSHKQKVGQCGPSSLKMVFAYYGLEKTEAELAKLTKCKPTVGTSAKNLVNVAKRFGFQAFYKDLAEIKDLRNYLRKNIPVIVNWFSTDEDHYSVVVGINKKDIYLKDPEIGRGRKMDINYFKKLWFGINGSILKSKDDLVIRRIIVIKK